MNDKELMQQALDALEEACEIVGKAWAWRDEKGRAAANALRARLAQPEPEPINYEDWKFNPMTGKPLWDNQPEPEPVELDQIEQYRLRIAAISTAAFGYWKKGDDINPEYDTPALRDVADLYAKYALLFDKLVAQPEHVHANDMSEERVHKTEKNEHEPVVWMYQDKSTHKVKFQKEMRSFVDHGATYEVPLYTSPPQRKEEPEPVGNVITFMTRAIFNIIIDHQEINGGYFISDGDASAVVDRLAKVIHSTFFRLSAPPQRERIVFPTMLRKMWSGDEVQAWLDENVNKEKNT